MGHLRCTTVGPSSSYSSFVIHMLWNDGRCAMIEPPFQTEYLFFCEILRKITVFAL